MSRCGFSLERAACTRVGCETRLMSVPAMWFGRVAGHVERRSFRGRGADESDVLIACSATIAPDGSDAVKLVGLRGLHTKGGGN